MSAAARKLGSMIAPFRPRRRGWSSTSIICAARSTSSIVPRSSRVLLSMSELICNSCPRIAWLRKFDTSVARATRIGTNWNTVRCVGGTSGSARPLISSGMSPAPISWSAAKVSTPPASRSSTP